MLVGLPVCLNTALAGTPTLFCSPSSWQSSQEEEDLGVCVGCKEAQHDLATCVSEEAWWFFSSTRLSRDPTWSTAFSSGAPNIRTQNCWSQSRGGTWRYLEGWSSSPVKTGWESWGCSAWRREGSRGTLYQPSSTWSRPIGKLACSVRVCSGRIRGNGFKL